MRLIDADKLCTDLLDRWDIVDTRKEELSRAVTADIITLIIACQPTIEPERKKGKWVDTGSGEQCSVCGEIQYGYDNYRFYCGFCGADMRGERDDSISD